MKKRIIAVLCVVALMLTVLAGCGKGETPSTDAPSGNAPSVNTPAQMTPRQPRASRPMLSSMHQLTCLS